MKCYACGVEVKESAKFCGACGADQSLRPAQESVCQHCGQEVEQNSRFCPHCGAARQVAAEPVAEEQIPIEETPALENTPVAEQEEASAAAEAEATPATESEPEPEPEPEPVSAPIPEPVAPVVEAAPVAEPAPQPVPQPAVQVAEQPVAQPQYQNPYQAPVQPQYQNPYQPGYQQSAYQPAYQPQQNIQVNLGAAPQRPAAAAYVQAPAYKIPCERGLLKMLLLSFLTCGIYPMVIYSRISVEINMVASRHDGKRTTHYLWTPVLGVLTLGIYMFVWLHDLCNRMGGELQRRQISYKFSAASYWLWNWVYGMVGAVITGTVVGVLMATAALEQSLVIAIGVVLLLASMVGPMVFIHKMLKAMNLINADYNRRG